MLSPADFTVLTIIVYLLASICGIFGMASRRTGWRKLGCWLALAAFFCQTFVLIMGFHKLMPAGLSLGAYLQLLAWFSLLCGIAAWWRLHQDAMLLFSAAFGLILFLMSEPSLNIVINLPASLSAPFYALHIGALFLSLGLLLLAFIAGIIFIFLEKRIKAKKNMVGIWQDMPALSVLDRINACCAMAAFPLYTIGIIAGLFWAKPVFGSNFNGDPKEVTSIIIWLLLAVLFHNRLATGWKGKKPAMLAIVIFVLSLLSFLVINFFMASHHSFIRNFANLQAWISR